jgi:hypothetical protein
MADRFKDLNIGSSQKKNSKVNNNPQRENIFKNSESKSSHDVKQRNTTGKSLKELAEENNNKGSGRYNSYRHKERGGGYRHGKGKMFTKTNIVKSSEKVKEEFNIEKIEFPELVKHVEKSEIVENIYKSKVNVIPEKNSKTQEVTLPKGWVNLKLANSLTRVNNDNNDNKELDISPYYNPKLAKTILDDRYKYREELNEILGDISPYWNMVYPEDLEDSDDNYDTDEISDEEEEYVEDW